MGFLLAYTGMINTLKTLYYMGLLVSKRKNSFMILTYKTTYDKINIVSRICIINAENIKGRLYKWRNITDIQG